jgi:hypothetical protein
MRKFLIASALVALTAIPATAQVRERTVTGAAIGADTGAVIAGPVGAVAGGVVAGGVVGGVIGGPRISRNRCWRDHNGYRHCRY